MKPWQQREKKKEERERKKKNGSLLWLLRRRQAHEQGRRKVSLWRSACKSCWSGTEKVLPFSISQHPSFFNPVSSIFCNLLTEPFNFWKRKKGFYLYTTWYVRPLIIVLFLIKYVSAFDFAFALYLANHTFWCFILSLQITSKPQFEIYKEKGNFGKRNSRDILSVILLFFKITESRGSSALFN